MATFRIVSVLTAPGTGQSAQIEVNTDSKEGAYGMLSDSIRFQARRWGMHPGLIQQSNQFFGAFDAPQQEPA